MKKLYMAALALVILAVGAFPALAEGGYQAITPEESVERYHEGVNHQFVDVRTPEEYDEAHIPGAVNVPLETIGAGEIAALADKEQELYVYCRTGVRSQQAAEALIALGYQNVYDLGGIVNWPYETISTAQENAPFLGLFTATDINGEPVDQSLFADHALTMINVWATYCPPCLNEMPDLGQLHADFADRGVQIVGLVSDAANYDGSISEDQVALAKEIVEKTGANYPHILPSDDLIRILLWQISSVPTTLFVDSAGNLVGNAYIGAFNYDDWANVIEETLALLPDAA